MPFDAQLVEAIRLAATRLAHDLVRVHPSFRFEERLAVRLGEAARAMRLRAAAGSLGSATPVPLRAPSPAVAASLDPLDAHSVRPLLVGGALTSAALSLAGAAWMAWRRSRPAPRSPMARAVRAAREARLVRGLS